MIGSSVVGRWDVGEVVVHCSVGRQAKRCPSSCSDARRRRLQPLDRPTRGTDLEVAAIPIEAEPFIDTTCRMIVFSDIQHDGRHAGPDHFTGHRPSKRSGMTTPPVLRPSIDITQRTNAKGGSEDMGARDCHELLSFTNAVVKTIGEHRRKKEVRRLAEIEPLDRLEIVRAKSAGTVGDHRTMMAWLQDHSHHGPFVVGRIAVLDQRQGLRPDDCIYILNIA